MPKVFVVRYLLLGIALSSVSFSALAVIVDTKTYSENRFNIVTSQNNQRQKSTLERIIDIFRRREDNGISRGDFCFIWPDMDREDALTIWRDKPIFVWKGTVKRIEVRPAASAHVLWRYEVKNNEQSVLYKGPALTPEWKYDYWVFYEVEKGEKNERIPFEILAAGRRAQIAKELATLAPQNSAMNAEEMALKRADYFAQQRLWPDVIQEIFSLPNPSSNWAAAQEKLRNQLCSTNAQSKGY